MAKPLTLIITTGTIQIEKKLESDDLGSYTIGRGTDVALFLNDPGISRKHCRIYADNGALLIEDCGSSGGTFVNGAKLTAPARLGDGDHVQIGGSNIMVRCQAEREAASVEATMVSPSVPKQPSLEKTPARSLPARSSAPEYYVSVEGNSTGPFGINDLGRQGLEPDTLLWVDGKPQWTPARQFPELAHLLALSVTPVQPSPAPRMPPPAPVHSPFQSHHVAHNQVGAVNVHVNAAPVVIMAPKSVGVAFLMVFFFGPLGMFYSTVLGALIMLVVTVVVGILTLGLGVLITQPICMVWACVAASGHNNRMMRMAGQRY